MYFVDANLKFTKTNCQKYRRRLFCQPVPEGKNAGYPLLLSLSEWYKQIDMTQLRNLRLIYLKTLIERLKKRNKNK